jgi:hypothetical protein
MQHGLDGCAVLVCHVPAGIYCCDALFKTTRYNASYRAGSAQRKALCKKVSKRPSFLRRAFSFAGYRPFTNNEVPGVPTGNIKWFNPDKSYGLFEQDDSNEDVFVH